MKATLLVLPAVTLTLIFTSCEKKTPSDSLADEIAKAKKWDDFTEQEKWKHLNEAAYARVETVVALSERYARKLEVMGDQIERNEILLRSQYEQLKTYQKVLDKWEEQAERFDKILDAWESGIKGANQSTQTTR